MPLNARRHLRRMRGGAQAHLIEAEDGCYYVVKFRNNPQHRRVLVNEVVGAVLLERLGISAAPFCVISVSREFLNANSALCLELGSRRVPFEPGWHFGSRYPGDPEKLAVYDFIPDLLLKQVVNLREFHGILAFDKWAGNADGRQSVFYRAGSGAAARRSGFHALMIDQGFLFNGPHWDFPDGPLYGLYHRPFVYEGVRSLDDFQPWLERIMNCPAEVLDEACRRLPLEWISGEERDLERLLETLWRRRRRVPDLLAEVKRARPSLFPNWN
jgi:hypothetical protein